MAAWPQNTVVSARYGGIFMPKHVSQTKTKQEWSLASVALRDAYTDFLLSRQAMNCTPITMSFYRFTAGKFLEWIERQGLTDPTQVAARHVRQYLAQLAAAGRADTTMHDHARGIKTLLRFWHAEGYTPAPVRFEMPRLEKKRLPVLTAGELREIVKACNVRDKAIVLFMAESGLRRAEVIKLNWGDVDMQSRLVRVRQGKGKKDRSAVIGATTRRALLAYRRTLTGLQDATPLFQTREGQPFTPSGFIRIFSRLTKATGIHVTAHALRRTFAILSLRAGMSPLHLQNLGGWASLDMVEHYAQMVDDDLLQAHRQYSPVDRLR
jgi:integrase/recombinase XerD